jgi:hypothetical protein
VCGLAWSSGSSILIEDARGPKFFTLREQLVSVGTKWPLNEGF